ncbi:MAG TPA: hypothetical protein VFJ48_11090, partial [Casimicrobiaceae bacterium]|nr:hypothetical protein [Casimicrobiaceae bacterium]
MAKAIAAARDFAWSGQHARTIDVATDALAANDSTDESRIALLELRAESLTAQGDIDRALDDAEAMVAIADRSKKAALQAQALSCLGRVQLASGGIAAAIETALRS